MELCQLDLLMDLKCKDVWRRWDRAPPGVGLRFRVCGLGFQFGLLDAGFVRVRSRGQVGVNLLRFPWFLRVREGLRSM